MKYYELSQKSSSTHVSRSDTLVDLETRAGYLHHRAGGHFDTVDLGAEPIDHRPRNT